MDCIFIWVVVIFGFFLIGVFLLDCMFVDVWEVKVVMLIWVELVEKRIWIVKVDFESGKFVNLYMNLKF